MEDYKENKKCWDNTQTMFKCCGVDSYTDWQRHGKEGKFN